MIQELTPTGEPLCFFKKELGKCPEDCPDYSLSFLLMTLQQAIDIAHAQNPDVEEVVVKFDSPDSADDKIATNGQIGAIPDGVDPVHLCLKLHQNRGSLR